MEAPAASRPTQKQPMTTLEEREQCPRCASRDTKFCYYNTSQPRHFCRTCRRYWTLGGSLRNVPFGGSTRNRKRPARPTRAIIAAARATTSSSAMAQPPYQAHLQVHRAGLLGSLLLGAAPLLEGRLGSDNDLGGQPALLGGLAHHQLGMGFGAGPLLWPTTAATTVVLEGDQALPVQACSSRRRPRGCGRRAQELAAAPLVVETGGLHHGGSPHLIL